MNEVRVIFHGRVQGVGFRSTVVDHARQWGVSGFTKNLADGSVEVVAQGEKDQLNSFLKAIESDCGAAKIVRSEKSFREPTEKFQRFSIAY